MKEIQLYAQKYRAQVIFAVICVAVIFIFFWVILPQLTVIGSTQQDISDVQKKLDITKKSVEVLSRDNAEELDKDLEVVTAALPPDKNITNIYSTLVETATKSDVSFEGFTVQLGDVYSKKAITESVEAGAGAPAIDVSATFGNINQSTFSTLAKNLAQAFPLSEITKVAVINGEGEVTINFFYKPYNLATIGRQDVVPELSSQQQELLNTLSQGNP